MLDWIIGNRGKRKKKRSAKKPPFEESKRVAAEGDVAQRRALARIDDLEPELLYYFATDQEPEVRRAVAGNEGTPLQADLLLARDAVDEVRADLAHKIGRLIPSLTPDENAKLTAMAFEVLEILAHDQLPRVRAIVADEIKHLENVPRTIVRALARDIETLVSAPILEYSPLLTQNELLQIIAGGIQGGALEAIARRRNISEEVSDAVVRQEHMPATRALLQNESAAISAKTLDSVAVAAAGQPELHPPLVNRANLSIATMRRIATFVSATLVEQLIRLNGLDEGIARDLRMAVRERLEHTPMEDDAPAELAAREQTNADEKAAGGGAEAAHRLHQAGKLDEDAFIDAIDDEDHDFVREGLALLSELKPKVVGKMLKSGSGKAVASLTWKAGMPMSLAMSLQRKVARVPAKQMLKESSTGGFPLPEDELQWYIDYFLSGKRG